ncbi:hypothetical protein EVAR_92089_1 [Eumeta japonica]|uniref:Uncharacterized protein n=1 Tax=Eumeta variegata TaxID=151549 RepID=A0A4C1T160_EUMVA|nr:hypothetical protein EVAR_92089_1 [Eumeta japonica]
MKRGFIYSVVCSAETGGARGAARGQRRRRPRQRGRVERGRGEEIRIDLTSLVGGVGTDCVNHTVNIQGDSVQLATFKGFVPLGVGYHNSTQDRLAGFTAPAFSAVSCRAAPRRIHGSDISD